MFRCQKCNKVTKPREKLNKIVVETRDKDYTKTYIDKNENIKEEYIGTGYEIVKEINVCEKCFNDKMGILEKL